MVLKGEKLEDGSSKLRFPFFERHSRPNRAENPENHITHSSSHVKRPRLQDNDSLQETSTQYNTRRDSKFHENDSEQVKASSATSNESADLTSRDKGKIRAHSPPKPCGDFVPIGVRRNMKSSITLGPATTLVTNGSSQRRKPLSPKDSIPASSPSNHFNDALQTTHGILNQSCPACGEKYITSTADALVFADISFRAAATGGSPTPIFACAACKDPTMSPEQFLLSMACILFAFDVWSRRQNADKLARRGKQRTNDKWSGKGVGYSGGFFRALLAAIFIPKRLRERSFYKSKSKNHDMLIEVIHCVTQLLVRLEHSVPNVLLDAKGLESLLTCSSLMDMSAELFRNHDIAEVMQEQKLYTSLTKLFRILATYTTTRSLVYNERIRTGELPRMSRIMDEVPVIAEEQVDTTAPFTETISFLAAQCDKMLKSGQGTNTENQVLLFIVELDEFLKANSSTAPRKVERRSSTAWQEELIVQEVEDWKLKERFAFQIPPETAGPSGRMRIIRQEIMRLQTSLPDGIFVRYAETQPYLMKFLIIGPRDTPYENGLYEFDLFCENNFPHSAPKVVFKSAGGNRINPNLYNNGYVCLSLLGTWPGEPWTAKSTILQLLISIQAMIFCEEPYFNEPYAIHDDIPGGPLSRAYNRGVYPIAVKNGMLIWLDKQVTRSWTMNSPRDSQVYITIWDEVVVKHFTQKKDEILAQVNGWREELFSAADAGTTAEFNANKKHYLTPIRDSLVPELSMELRSIMNDLFFLTPLRDRQKERL